MSSYTRIEKGIDEILEFLETCKPKGFSNTQIIVPKEELIERIDELKLKVPEEVAYCKRFIEKRDEYIKETEVKAQKIIEEAEATAKAMVLESEIMRQAYLQANEFIARANQEAAETRTQASSEAEMIRNGALEYTKNMLASVESVLTLAYNDTKAKSDEYLEALYRNLEIVTANRKELVDEVAPAEEVPPLEYSEEELSDSQFFGTSSSDEEDEFDSMDSDSFLHGIE